MLIYDSHPQREEVAKAFLGNVWQCWSPIYTSGWRWMRRIFSDAEQSEENHV